jgi:DNA-directed RNA polymerase subunit beta
MKNIFVNNISDLASIQHFSFFRFLFHGLSEELKVLENPINISKVRKKEGSSLKQFRKKKIQATLPLALTYLYTNDLKVKGPNLSLSTCLKKELSYTIQIFVPCFYTTYRKGKNVLALNNLNSPLEICFHQDSFLTEIPLMTEEGTFLIEGVERIVISQIIRSPGIYFKKYYRGERLVSYTAMVISSQGVWTEIDTQAFTFQNSHSITVHNPTDFDSSRILTVFKNIEEYNVQEINKKITDNTSSHSIDFSPLNVSYLFEFFEYFGISSQEVIDSLNQKNAIIFEKLYATDNCVLSENLFFEENFNEERILVEKTREKVQADIQGKFLVPKSGLFFIGEIGRVQVNYQLGLNLPHNLTYLTGHDFVKIIDKIIELNFQYQAKERIVIQDIDDLKNKIIRSVGELLQIQFRRGISNLSLPIKVHWGGHLPNFDGQPNSLKVSSDYLILPGQLSRMIKDFFKTSQLSQYMDQTNPLAELTHKRRISVFGPNGLNRENISLSIRDIHPSQYGRLCPIETPEGQNAGLINALTVFGKVNLHGSLETPYFVIENGELQRSIKPVYLNTFQESKVAIAFSDDILNRLQNQYVSIKENHIFSLKKQKEIHFLMISPLQILSIATSLIPFLEHNDANRALMGANMQRQAIPLLYPEAPIVGTGLESNIVLESRMVMKTSSEGIVIYASNQEIIIKDNFFQQISYKLRKNIRSNQKTEINQRPLVWNNEKVFSGQVITDGPSTKDGELALGRNLIVAYMMWEGYNYEDAIVINENIVSQDYLTSVHIQECETILALSGEEKLTRNIRSVPKYKRRHLDRYGIVKLGSYVKEDDILVGKSKIAERNPSPLFNLLRAIAKEKEEKQKKSALQTQTNKDILLTGEKEKIDKTIEFLVKNVFQKFSFFNCSKKEKREKEKEIKEIAKQSKIVYIQKQKEDKKKSTNEIKKNKKQNTIKGQKLTKKIAEKYTEKKKKIGKEVYYRNTSFRVPHGKEGRIISVQVFSIFSYSENQEFQGFNEEQIRVKIRIAQIRKIEVGDKLSGRHGNKGIVSRILSSSDMPFLPDGTPVDIIFNPLGVPSRMNIGQLFESLLGLAGEKLGKRFKIFPFDEIYGKESSRILVNQKLKQASIKSNTKWLFHPNYVGKIMIRDGRTGEYFDNPITVGKSYILKLIHLVEDKIHTRSIGPYAMITEQPLGGKSQNGGQRFGEMEVWALEGYGCSHTLQELLTVKSDDIEGRNDLYYSLLTPGEKGEEKKKPLPAIPDAFLTMIRELQSLGLDFSSHFLKGKIIPQTSEIDLFLQLENRMKLRAFIHREKMEYFYIFEKNKKEISLEDSELWKEKKRILEKFKNNI